MDEEDVRETITVHDHDPDAHELSTLRQQMEITDSKTGMWSIKAADDFNGPDGPLTTAPVGGQAWTAIGGAQLSRINNVARTPDGTLRGSYLVTGVSDGQVEAGLAPGDNEASIYFRFLSNGNYLMLGRKFDGFVGVFRFSGGGSVLLHQPIYHALIAEERFKVRFVGDRIWVFRIANGEEQLLVDLVEPMFNTAGSHGLRLAGTGAADNFRILQREAL